MKILQNLRMFIKEQRPLTFFEDSKVARKMFWTQPFYRQKYLITIGPMEAWWPRGLGLQCFERRKSPLLDKKSSYIFIQFSHFDNQFVISKKID